MQLTAYAKNTKVIGQIEHLLKQNGLAVLTPSNLTQLHQHPASQYFRRKKNKKTLKLKCDNSVAEIPSLTGMSFNRNCRNRKKPTNTKDKIRVMNKKN